MKKIFILLALSMLASIFITCDKQKNNQHLVGETTGCGNFFVARVIEEDKILSIWIDHEKITFSTDFQVFENAVEENFVVLDLEQNCEIDEIWYGTCNDVAGLSKCSSTHWKPTQGKLSFKVSKVLDFYDCFTNELYEATVILEDATFRKEGSNETLSFDNTTFSNVLVGWCAG